MRGREEGVGGGEGVEAAEEDHEKIRTREAIFPREGKGEGGEGGRGRGRRGCGSRRPDPLSPSNWSVGFEF